MCVAHCTEHHEAQHVFIRAVALPVKQTFGNFIPAKISKQRVLPKAGLRKRSGVQSALKRK